MRPSLISSIRMNYAMTSHIITQSEEVWKPIFEYEGLYQISSLGNIFSLKTKKYMRPRKNKDGYLIIGLRKEKNTKTFLVHRLVIYSFFLKKDMCVDHINRKRDDNRVENLRYISIRENAVHRNNGSLGAVGIDKTNSVKNPWRAYIRKCGKRVYLGSFPTKEKASDAYQNAALLLSISDEETCAEFIRSRIKNKIDT